MKRIFWVRDFSSGNLKTGYAFNKQEEVIVALKGNFDIVITHQNGNTEKFTLDSPHYGLHVQPLTWLHVENVSEKALGFYLTNTDYNANNYITDFELFKNGINK